MKPRKMSRKNSNLFLIKLQYYAFELFKGINVYMLCIIFKKNFISRCGFCFVLFQRMVREIILNLEIFLIVF